MQFTDRQDAGRRLGEALIRLGLERPVVLGIPRGGVVVGAEAARLLHAPLDIVLVRKLRHPSQPELAIGAIGEDGAAFLHEDTVEGVSEEAVFREERIRLEELRHKAEVYRAVRTPVDLEGRTAVLVDDGVATGSTMAAAARLTRTRRPVRLVIALPVAPVSAREALHREADSVVCIHTPRTFAAVGQFYESFHETTDEVVVALLRAAVES